MRACTGTNLPKKVCPCCCCLNCLLCSPANITSKAVVVALRALVATLTAVFLRACSSSLLPDLHLGKQRLISLNQSTNQSVSQSVHQPTNQPTKSQPLNQSINQSVSQSINQSIIASLTQLTGLRNQQTTAHADLMASTLASKACALERSIRRCCWRCACSLRRARDCLSQACR